MKRLNGIATVLLDPGERRRYDAMLECPPPNLKLWRGRHREIWFWLAAAGIGLAAPVWVFSGPVHEAAPVAQPEKPEPRAAVSGSEKVEPAASAALLRELRATRRELERLRRKQPIRERPRQAMRWASPAGPEEAVGIDPPPVPFAATVPRPITPETLGPVPVVNLPAWDLAGNWFYMPGTQRFKSKGEYAPEYIELRLSEGGGQIRGRYRARYRVTDQAISPAVAFDFDGPGGATDVTLPWRGAGGARGEVTLRLVSENLLEVRWRAHRLSDELGLVSGSAALVRLRDP